jgi:arginyl-tRNA--protein-N-Asp/Glu arginylyltransferase
VTRHPRDTPQFYLTAPSPCPYLAGKEERKVFTHLVGERAAELNNMLTQGGFRRSQSIAYRPACEGCRSCVSVRVIAKEFRPTRSMRRIFNRNTDIASEMKVAVPTSEQYAIFRSYLDSRHRDGGMADMTVLDYAMMVEDSHIETRIIEYRRNQPASILPRERRDENDVKLGGGEEREHRNSLHSTRFAPFSSPAPLRSASTDKQRFGSHLEARERSKARSAGELIAVALTDVLADGLSMVYSFFAPEEAARSLGTFMVLDHIARAHSMGLSYVYLGYWVRGSRKMDYKGRFLPQERLTPDGWVKVG